MGIWAGAVGVVAGLKFRISKRRWAGHLGDALVGRDVDRLMRPNWASRPCWIPRGGIAVVSLAAPQARRSIEVVPVCQAVAASVGVGAACCGLCARRVRLPNDFATASRRRL